MEGSTFLSEILAIETKGVTIVGAEACGLDKHGVGLCTAAVSGGSGAQAAAVTEVFSTTVKFGPIAIEATDTPDSHSSAVATVPRFVALVAIALILGAVVTLL